MDWMLQNIPTVVWLVVGGAAVFALHRYIGLRAAIVMAITTALIIMTSRARKDGWQAREEKGRQDADKAIIEAEAARRESDRRSADPERLRQSDGFRRD